MTLVEIVSARITSLCKENGLTISKLAEKSGVPRSTLSGIVDCRVKNPSVTTLIAVSHAFGMKLSEFLNIPELNHYFE